MTSSEKRSQLRLPSDPSAPAAARAAVRQLNGTLTPMLLEKLGLIASELVTNALRHAVAADPAPTLTLAVAPNRVTIAVSDDGSSFDAVAASRSPGVDGGFGLRLVDSIADRWWIERGSDRDGTRVVCELTR
jgi:anti-sigma regulatory factor (Ser/Thr protein kinase)